MGTTKTSALSTTDVVSSHKKAKPFLKWVGGKGQLISQYQSLLPPIFNRYFEPFVGGGAMFFSLEPKKAHVNDSNHVLMSAYSNIKNDVEKIITDLTKLEKKYKSILDVESQKIFFYDIREQFNALHDEDPKKTELLIFLNRTCFNGLYRENRKGHFNVPFGKYPNPTICDATNLRAVSVALRQTTTSCLSFEDAVKTAKKGDFVYFDPPYYPLNATSNFTSYHENDFTEKDQIKLRDTFKKLADKGVLVMLSNSNTKFIKDLYQEYNIHKVMAGRAINSNASKRGKIEEIVVTSY